MDLIKKKILLFDKEIFKPVVVDREFVGQEWLSFLNRNEIKYYMRIRNNFKEFLPHKNKEIKATHVFNRFKIKCF